MAYVKTHHGGVAPIAGLGETLGIGDRRLNRLLSWMISNNWIGSDGERLFDRSWASIVGERYRGVYVPAYAVLEKKQFDLYAFSGVVIFATLIHYRCTRYKSRIKAIRKGLQHRGGISCRLAGDLFGCSKTQAWKMRKEAHAAGLIVLEPRMELCSHYVVSEVDYLNEEYPNRYFVAWGGKVYERVAYKVSKGSILIK